MAGNDSVIAFACGSCNHAMKAPAASAGRAGRCPRCQAMVVVPSRQIPSAAVFSFVQASSPAAERDEKKLFVRSLLQSAIASLVLHLVILSAMGLVFVKSRDLGRAIVATLFFDTYGTDLDLTDPVLELGNPTPTPLDTALKMDVDWNPAITGDLNLAGQVGAGPGNARQGMISDSPLNSDSITPFARFSSKVSDRLSRQPAARQGDYEVALFWDGPSDLDLHVDYYASGSLQRKINYANKGSPETGFLDVDQNFKQPYVEDPIEHVRWETKSPPAGVYAIRVVGYSLRPASGSAPGTPPPAVVPFTLELKTPDGLQTFTGFARQTTSSEVTALTIGGSLEQGRKLESTAARQLEEARKKIQQDTPTSRRSARAMLLNVIRKFPKSDAAKEANNLLREL